MQLDTSWICTTSKFVYRTAKRDSSLIDDAKTMRIFQVFTRSSTFSHVFRSLSSCITEVFFQTRYDADELEDELRIITSKDRCIEHGKNIVIWKIAGENIHVFSTAFVCTRLRDFQERRIRPCRPPRFRVTLSSGWLFVCFSGEPALRSGSAMSRRFPRQQRTYAVQRAQFRSRPRYHYVLASGAVLQHLPVDDGRWASSRYLRVIL